MTRPDEVLASVNTALKESGRLPSSTTYSEFELDSSGGQSNVRPPVVETTIIDTVRSQPTNTDFAGFAEDEQGNQVGYIFDATFEMTMQIDVWTAEGDDHDMHRIGENVRRALYRYDDHRYNDPLPDPSDPSSPLPNVDYFSVDDGRVANDLTMTPALRRWRQEAVCWFAETVDTSEEYGEEDVILDVIYPEDGDFVAGTDNVEIVFDATASTESAADDYT